MPPHPATRRVRLRRSLALLGLTFLLPLAAACGGEDEDVVTIVHTETVPAATSSAGSTAEAATTEAGAPESAPPESAEQPSGTTWVSPESTVPPPSTEVSEPPTESAPQQYTIGGSDPQPSNPEEPPPETTDVPPESVEEPPAEETVDPGVERPADFPTKREQRLLSLLYADIANQCTRTQPGDVTRGANASVYCDIRTGDKVQAWYEGFPNLAAMRRAYDRFRSGRQIGPNLRSCQPSQRYPAEAPWFIGEEANTKGRLLCFVEDGDVWLIWSDDRYASLGWAVNRGGKKQVVWDYWSGRGLLGAAG